MLTSWLASVLSGVISKPDPAPRTGLPSEPDDRRICRECAHDWRLWHYSDGMHRTLPARICPACSGESK